MSLRGQPPVDGAYWTLHFEWMFYFMMLLVITFASSRWLEYGLIVWIVGIIFAPPVPLGSHLWSYYSASFITGAVAGRASQLGWSKLRILICLVAAGLFLNGELAMAARRFGHWSGMLVIGVMLLSFIALAVGATFPRLARIRIPLAGLGGRLTYPVYLLHAHLGYMTINRFATEENKVWLLTIMLIVLFLSAWGIERLVDGALGKFWKRAGEILVQEPMDALLRKVRLLPHP